MLAGPDGRRPAQLEELGVLRSNASVDLVHKGDHVRVLPVDGRDGVGRVLEHKYSRGAGLLSQPQARKRGERINPNPVGTQLHFKSLASGDVLRSVGPHALLKPLAVRPDERELGRLAVSVPVQGHSLVDHRRGQRTGLLRPQLAGTLASAPLTCSGSGRARG